MNSIVKVTWHIGNAILLANADHVDKMSLDFILRSVFVPAVALSHAPTHSIIEISLQLNSLSHSVRGVGDM